MSKTGISDRNGYTEWELFPSFPGLEIIATSYFIFTGVPRRRTLTMAPLTCTSLFLAIIIQPPTFLAFSLVSLWEMQVELSQVSKKAARTSCCWHRESISWGVVGVRGLVLPSLCLWSTRLTSREPRRLCCQVVGRVMLTKHSNCAVWGWLKNPTQSHAHASLHFQELK